MIFPIKFVTSPQKVFIWLHSHIHVWFCLIKCGQLFYFIYFFGKLMQYRFTMLLYLLKLIPTNPLCPFAISDFKKKNKASIIHCWVIPKQFWPPSRPLSSVFPRILSGLVPRELVNSLSGESQRSPELFHRSRDVQIPRRSSFVLVRRPW